MRGNTYGYSGEIDERKTRMWMTSDSNAVTRLRRSRMTRIYTNHL